MERPGLSANGGLQDLIKVPESAKIPPTNTPTTHTREKTRPTRGHVRHFREQTRPARHKTSILGHFARAGRILSRYRHRQSALGELCRTHATYRAAR